MRTPPVQNEPTASQDHLRSAAKRTHLPRAACSRPVQNEPISSGRVSAAKTNPPALTTTLLRCKTNPPLLGPALRSQNEPTASHDDLRFATKRTHLIARPAPGRYKTNPSPRAASPQPKRTHRLSRPPSAAKRTHLLPICGPSRRTKQTHLLARSAPARYKTNPPHRAAPLPHYKTNPNSPQAHSNRGNSHVANSFAALKRI